jgi:hypothetical protein
MRANVCSGSLTTYQEHITALSAIACEPDIATSINLAAFEARLFVCAVAKWFVRGFPAAT